MAMIKTGTFFPVKTIIGKDLDVRGTFNADVRAGTDLIPAGRFMSYHPTNKVFAPYAGAWTDVGANDPITGIFGILAQDVDSTPSMPGNIPNVAMVYRAGTFLAQEIEEANAPVPANGIRDAGFLNALRLKGIMFEWSWEGYALMENPPTGTPPIP